MSQIQNDHVINLDHYQNNMLEPRKVETEAPKELQNARPSSGASGWKTAGRVMLGIATCGFSELIMLAYRGIRSCFSKCAPAPASAPRTGQSTGLPAANPQADKLNADLASAASGKKEWPQEYRAAVDEVLDELRGNFGDKYLPAGKSLLDIVGGLKEINPNAKRLMYSAIKEAKHAVSPQDLRNIIRSHLQPLLRQMVLVNKAKEFAAQAGGLGGMDMADIVQNMLTDRSLSKKLSSLDSEAEVQRFAETMKLGQKMQGIRATMDSTLNELRSIYGAGTLPEKLEDALLLTNEHGTKICSRLDDSFRGALSPISTQSLKEKLMEEFLPVLQQGAVERALSEKAGKMGFALSRQAGVMLARSVLDNAQNRAAMNKATDAAALQTTLDAMDLDGILQTQKASVESMYRKHAETVAPELRPMLRTFIEGLSFAPGNAADSEKLVADLAKHMKDWKNLIGAETERRDLNAYLKNNFSNDLKKLEGSGESTGYTDNIYNTLLADAHRSSYSVEGRAIPTENAAPQLVSALKDAVPDPKDQQFISKLINQRMWACMLTLGQGFLEDGRLLADVQGGSSFPGNMNGWGQMLGDIKGIGANFNVTVSPDKTTAHVTANLTQGLHFPQSMSVDGLVPNFGAVRFSFDFELNLNGHAQGQSVEKVSFGQQFIPLDQIQHAAK